MTVSLGTRPWDAAALPTTAISRAPRVPDPPAAAGRLCERCGRPLSRWNETARCFSRCTPTGDRP